MNPQTLKRLSSINWEFSDYRGMQTFPTDINSLHWYPAPFLPQIPAIIIQALTSRGDTVLDPFAGSGVTLIEATRLGRKSIGTDINPYAVEIVRAKFHAIRIADECWVSGIKKDLLSLRDQVDDCVPSSESPIRSEIDTEVEKWFEKKTLCELLALYDYVNSEIGEDRLVKKMAFSSILLRSCSQKDHYTYVTDRCFPKTLSYAPALDMFDSHIELIASAAERFRNHYKSTFGREWTGEDCTIIQGDARKLGFIEDESVDVVVTSPPYLGVNDYVRSMRLTSLFFPEEGMSEAMNNEIGARRKRNRRGAYEEYLNEMKVSLAEIARVLKPSSFLCLTMGQGRGRVCKGEVVDELLEYLKRELGFEVRLRQNRSIKFRRIQVQGIGCEEIILLNRGERNNI
jgi:DNA modification methylase